MEWNSLLPCLYAAYRAELEHVPAAIPLSRDGFDRYVSERADGLRCAVSERFGRPVGAILYRSSEENGVGRCEIPVFGTFADSADVLDRLFQQVAEESAACGRCRFSVRLYAHDEPALRLFSMLQFGYMAETGVRRARIGSIPGTLPHGVTVRELAKAELVERWGEVWALTAAIVEHLRRSPVFYPGTEFTEEVYRAFYLDGDARVFAAERGNRLVGMIESNAEAEPLAAGARTANVGEVYVLPELRGTGLAAYLLSFAEDRASEQGAKTLWVEHGTANPNARRFWGRYFDTWQYELTREVVIPRA